MKRILSAMVSLLCVFSLTGCASNQGGQRDVQYDFRPMIVIGDEKYIDPYMPVNELPEEYVYIGELTDDEAYNTGLAGCKMYANSDKERMCDFYLYQECGTPVSEDTVDSTRRQWAYVQWIVLEE